MSGGAVIRQVYRARHEMQTLQRTHSAPVERRPANRVDHSVEAFLPTGPSVHLGEMVGQFSTQASAVGQ
jgi:hypothetical protein